MKFVLVVMSLFIAMIPVESAAAQDNSTSIGVTPAIVDLPLQVGQSETRRLQVTNNNPVALPISLEAQSANISGEPLSDINNGRYDVSTWIAFEEQTLLFEPGETKLIPFTVTAPFTASAGGHYAQISLRTLTLETDRQLDLIFPEIAVPLLITVPGEITEKIEIQDILLPKTVTANDSMQTEIIVENTGSVHNLISGTLFIYQDEKEIGAYDVQSRVVLPDTKNTIIVPWETPDRGVYQVFAQLRYGSGGSVDTSNTRSLYVTPSFHSLALLASSIWIGLYLLPRRKNVRSAIDVFIKS
jgi:hypothetical protein